MWELDHKEGWEWNNWCLWTVVLEKTLESPLDNREIKLVNPKGNQPWLMLKLQYFGHVMPRANSLGKTLMLGKIEDKRRRDGWMASLTQWTWIWVDCGSWWWTGRPGMLRFMGHKESDMTEWLNWTELNIHGNFPMYFSWFFWFLSFWLTLSFLA